MAKVMDRAGYVLFLIALGATAVLLYAIGLLILIPAFIVERVRYMLIPLRAKWQLRVLMVEYRLSASATLQNTDS